MRLSKKLFVKVAALAVLSIFSQMQIADNAEASKKSFMHEGNGSALHIKVPMQLPEPRPVQRHMEPGVPTILGEPVATKEQCVEYLLKVNPTPNISVSPEELVSNYYEEGLREGVRPDIAFAQAIEETGFFRYGGAVIPQQNNFCGLGTVNSGGRGAWFSNVQLGVRAHIQHILAYSSTEPPKIDIVDPRYSLVMTTRNFGKARYWTDLNGKWAIPGTTYGQKILQIYQGILEQNQ